MTSNTPTIGILIITKNEELNLDACLQTCQQFKEILIIDSFSTDATETIARKYTPHFIQRAFTTHPDQRWFGLQQMTSDWVFILDADERMTPELIAAITQVATENHYTALEFPRKNYLAGEWIQHCGWFPDFQTRFFKRSTMINAEEPVHGRFGTTGPRLQLPADSPAVLIHYTYRTLSQYFRKIDDFTTLDAAYYRDKNVLKITRWAIFSRSLGMFTQTLFHHKGYKDGMRGFIVSGIQFIYSFMLMTKIWELQQNLSQNDADAR